MKVILASLILFSSATAWCIDQARCAQYCSSNQCPTGLSVCAGVAPDAGCVASCMATNGGLDLPNAVVDNSKGQPLAFPSGPTVNCQTLCSPGTNICHPVCSGAPPPSTVNGAQDILAAQVSNCHTSCIGTGAGQRCYQSCQAPRGSSAVPQGWIDAQSGVKQQHANRVLPGSDAQRSQVQESLREAAIGTAEAERQREILSEQVEHAPMALEFSGSGDPQ